MIESVHGTLSCYILHRRHRHPPCQPCLDAWNTYQREWQAAHREQANAARRARRARQRGTSHEVPEHA